MSRLILIYKALRELGPRQLGLYAWYKLLLHSGYLRKRSSAAAGRWTLDGGRPRAVLNLPSRDELISTIGNDGLSRILAEADEIVDLQVRLFGGHPVPLVLTPPGKLSHWTDYERRRKGVEEQGVRKDIKFIWEPARYGWAFTLGLAYHLSGDERYPESFWRYFEIFEDDNPINMGPNWASAQEVALRLIAFVFASQIFLLSQHSTSARNSQLATAIAQHAARIPLTLIYARAQNNNHLLSEAAGLITASIALPDHPEASIWSKLGWKWFNHGLETQTAEDGAYMQHSTNYHRLMLQLSLWIRAIQQSTGLAEGKMGERAICNLQHATQWLLSLTDSESGRVPNLGPNDGAYILPLSILPFHDYRPVLQGASYAFLGEPAFESGPWDEMALWLCSGIKCQVSGDNSESEKRGTWNAKRKNLPSTLHAARSWAYFRAAKFNDRPGHADQLHLDLWWRGLNVAQDAGTYLYNAEPPWDNALTHTAVHNTVVIDGFEQMTSAGRFLYLDWAQAEIISQERAEDGTWQKVTAQHDGYHNLGITHQSSVTAHKEDHWVIEDQLLPASRSTPPANRSARLHWLLPDWDWKIDDSGLKIEILSPYGWICLVISGQWSVTSVQLVRAGELLHGSGQISPTWGWVSPTYGVKIPALSFSVSVEDVLPITLKSEWTFPTDE